MKFLQSRNFPLLIGFLLSIGAVIAGFWLGASHLDGAQLAARWTARVGAPIFLISYLASTFLRLSKNDIAKALMRRRRQWGLAFAWTHSVHLAALIYFTVVAEMPVDLMTMLGGGGAYFMIYVMAATSNDWSVRKLRKYWKMIHRFGAHYIWFIFSFTYFNGLFGADTMMAAIIGMGSFIAAALLRLYTRYR